MALGQEPQEKIRLRGRAMAEVRAGILEQRSAGERTETILGNVEHNSGEG